MFSIFTSTVADSKTLNPAKSINVVGLYSSVKCLRIDFPYPALINLFDVMKESVAFGFNNFIPIS